MRVHPSLNHGVKVSGAHSISACSTANESEDDRGEYQRRPRRCGAVTNRFPRTVSNPSIV
jgi:hypothetical protein